MKTYNIELKIERLHYVTEQIEADSLEEAEELADQHFKIDESSSMSYIYQRERRFVSIERVSLEENE